MKKRWTRRGFLQTSLGGTLSARSTLAGVALQNQIADAQSSPKTNEPGPAAFTKPQRNLLRSAMDEIIPAADGMPAASEAGCDQYLEKVAAQSPDIRKNLTKSLAALDALSRKQFGQSFTDLPPASRIEALGKMEKGIDALHFGVLRDYVYEAYYLQPRVWKLIGYEFHPTNLGGPQMQPFDGSALAKVRKMPKLYREVD